MQQLKTCPIQSLGIKVAILINLGLTGRYANYE